MALKKPTKRWSQEVTENSDALDLEKGVFKLKNPKKIALSLKRSAEQSTRRKSDPYRSAMSMLTFYINRAGKGLSETDRNRLEKAKVELRIVSTVRELNNNHKMEAASAPYIALTHARFVP